MHIDQVLVKVKEEEEDFV